MKRRSFVAVGVTFLGGCSGMSGSGTPTEEVQDSDGDGVVDSEDYAPNDPDVQSESDLSTQTASPAPTSTETASPTPTPTETASPTPTPTPVEITAAVGSEFEDSVTVPSFGYYRVFFPMPVEFTLSYEVENLKDSRHSVDVLFRDREEFDAYDSYVKNHGVEEPEIYEGESTFEVTDSQFHITGLPAGEYAFVVDNTNYYSTGEAGNSAEREARISLQTQRA